MRSIVDYSYLCYILFIELNKGMNMENIDYVRVSGFDAKRKIKKVYGYKFLPYAPFIVACRLLDWRHTEILEFLYSEIEEFKSEGKADRINNNDLSKMVSYWKTNNLIDFNKVDIEKNLIANSSASEVRKEVIAQQDNINIFKNRLADFLNAVSKRNGKSIDGEEMPALRNYFNDFGNKYELEELVNQYFNQRSSQWAQ